MSGSILDARDFRSLIIVDAHVNVTQQNCPTDQVLARLSEFDIDTACIFADSESPDLTSENRYVLRTGQEFACSPFYYLGGNPFTDTRMDLEIPHDLDEYAGLRWHRWFGEGPDRAGRIDHHELDFAVVMMESPEFEAVMAALAYNDKPIIFEEDFGVTSEFIIRYGELNVIIPHLGTLSGGTENAVGRWSRNPNVYFTTSYGVIDDTTLSRLALSGSCTLLTFRTGIPHRISRRSGN